MVSAYVAAPQIYAWRGKHDFSETLISLQVSPGVVAATSTSVGQGTGQRHIAEALFWKPFKDMGRPGSTTRSHTDKGKSQVE